MVHAPRLGWTERGNLLDLKTLIYCLTKVLLLTLEQFFMSKSDSLHLIAQSRKKAMKVPHSFNEAFGVQFSSIININHAIQHSDVLQRRVCTRYMYTHAIHSFTSNLGDWVIKRFSFNWQRAGWDNAFERLIPFVISFTFNKVKLFFIAVGSARNPKKNWEKRRWICDDISL